MTEPDPPPENQPTMAMSVLLEVAPGDMSPRIRTVLLGIALTEVGEVTRNRLLIDKWGEEYPF